jgi:hypothetical protein
MGVCQIRESGKPERYFEKFYNSLQSRIGWTQEAPSKGAGISNIDYINFEVMVASMWLKRRKSAAIQHFSIRHSLFDIHYSLLFSIEHPTSKLEWKKRGLSGF